MIDLIDLSETRHDSPDLSDLQSLLKQLLGQPFRFFRVSYGDELRLHLGELQGDSKSGMRGRTKGSYVLAARASSWVVYSAPRLILAASDHVRVPPDNPQAMTRRVEIGEIEKGEWITPGSVVIFAGAERVPHGFSFQLRFSDNSTVYVSPTSEFSEDPLDGETSSEDPGGVEISDWEVMTPHQRILRVGPGPRWNYLDSTKRRSESSASPRWAP